MNFLILMLASALSGYTIGEIGIYYGLPLWISCILGAAFGWLIGGTYQP